MKKVKVELTNGKIVILLLNKEEQKALEAELGGFKQYIGEYVTDKGDVVCDLDIVCRG